MTGNIFNRRDVETNAPTIWVFFRQTLSELVVSAEITIRGMPDACHGCMMKVYSDFLSPVMTNIPVSAQKAPFSPIAGFAAVGQFVQ